MQQLVFPRQYAKSAKPNDRVAGYAYLAPAGAWPIPFEHRLVRELAREH